MTADRYNESVLARALDPSVPEEKRFRPEHLTLLGECWQRQHGLAVDGYVGPNTLLSLDEELRRRQPKPRVWPLVAMPDGRLPVITSGFYTENPDRSDHKGVDLFYRWLDSDPDVPFGDGGAIMRNGRRQWWIPPRDLFPQARHVLAAASGVVRQAGVIKTGFRLWIDHPDGSSTGYFHLSEIWVADNTVVAAGQSLGLVGDNPSVHDGAHLHFEVSPAGRYAPMNPRPWLERAVYLSPQEAAPAA